MSKQRSQPPEMPPQTATGALAPAEARDEPAAFIAHLGMYDWPETTAMLARFWTEVAARLRAAGLAAPHELARNRDFNSIWRDPNLLLAQTCGYPYAKQLRGEVRLLASPVYDVEGCSGPTYSSVIIAPRGDGRRELADFKGARAAINGWDSQSGMSALRAVIAPLAENGRFFDKVLISGSHRNSLTMVAQGNAELAAIDAVCWAMAKRYCAADVARLRVVGWGPVAPSLPFISAALRSDADCALICAALADTIADPDNAALTRNLGLAGIEVLGDPAYDRIVEIENEAIALGYGVIG